MGLAYFLLGIAGFFYATLGPHCYTDLPIWLSGAFFSLGVVTLISREPRPGAPPPQTSA